MLLVYVAGAWVAGLAAGSLIRLPPEVWTWWLILPAGLAVIWRRDPALLRIHFCLFVFLLAAVRATAAAPHGDEHSLAAWNDRGARALIGDVIEPVQVGDRVASLRLAVTRVRDGSTWLDADGLALVQVARETDVRYGDRLQVYGEPATPADFEDFSYKEYLARQGIHSVVRSYGAVMILAREQGDPFHTALYAFKARALAAVNAILPEPAAALLAGILLGDDSGLPRKVQDDFQATNTAHIIAISGFNISIIAGLLARLTRRFLSARPAVAVIVAGLAIYTLLVGASASVVRAAIMGSLAVLALFFRRQNESLNALAIAAIGMTAWNPPVLWDAGFQLSFLATLGLVLYTEPLTRGLESLLGRIFSGDRARQITAALGDAFVVTLAAQITTTPLIVFSFHRLSLIGLVANLFVLPAQPAVMVLGGAATLVAMVVPPVGQALAWLAWAFLEWTIALVQFFAGLPFASIEVGHFDLPLLALVYALLFGATLVDWRTWLSRLTLRPALALGIGVIAIVWVWNLALTAPDGKTHVEFLDVGGPATLVRTPRGAKVLVDGGASPSALLAALGERMPFWDRSLDLVVLTRGDDAHLAGLVAALERYDVGQIIQVSAPAKPTAAYLKWQDGISLRRVPARAAAEGLRVEADRGVALEIVAAKEARDSGALVRLQAGPLSVLFAQGSTQAEQQEWVGRAEPSIVLVAPSRVDPAFVAAVDPQFAVLFTGQVGRSAPSADLLDALSGATVLQTGERGTIEFVVDGAAVRVGTEREPRKVLAGSPTIGAPY